MSGRLNLAAGLQQLMEMQPVRLCTGINDQDRPCSKVAVREAVAGCVHEHVGPRHLCRDHETFIQDGKAYCGDCFGGHHPHLCLLAEVEAKP